MLERQTLLHLLGAAGEEAAAESAMADPSDKSDES
jgi:hypothetical protein